MSKSIASFTLGKDELIEELTLKLSDPTVIEVDGEYRVGATAQLIYYSAQDDRLIQSQPYAFEAPIGLIEQNDIRWYIESYYRWPTGVFKTRANKTEEALPQWGRALYNAMQADISTQESINAWLEQTGDLRFSVEVNARPVKHADEEKVTAMRKAACSLFSLPWEILHDGVNYLFQGSNGIQVRRRLPDSRYSMTLIAKLPIRVLLLSPRPEISDDGREVGYLDHRSSAIPLVQAMENLGEALVKVDILPVPTFSALKVALQQAKDQNCPYEVVHFDGHGVYDPGEDMGALCFEKGFDKDSQPRIMQLVYADDLAIALREYGVPLVYLDACQTAQAKDDPRASVAAKLLEQGVGSVVAMSHSVLVETAWRFVESFYHSLAAGHRVGDAMLAGKNALYNDTYRDKITGAGSLELQDWFVPVLYQAADDPQLFNVKVSDTAGSLTQESRQPNLGKLPEAPEHTFVGRSYTLLQLERLLQNESYVVIKGGGGMGKTAIAAELCRWLVRSGRFGRAVFVSVESQNVQDIKGVIDLIGRQLLTKYTVTQYSDDTRAALQPIEQALIDESTLFLFDNMESVLPDYKGINPAGVADVTDLLNLCQTLLTTKTTRLLFTSRETLPAPFSDAKNTVSLGRLGHAEAIELVENVMVKYDKLPPENDNVTAPEQIVELVEAVSCHPRALVLLAREIDKGVKATTENISQLMAKLEAQNPGDRENSLYASVELSLRRLPSEVRERLNRVAVLYGGGHLFIWQELLGVETEVANAIAHLLTEAGLVQRMEYNYLSVDPALPDYLKQGLSVEQLTECINHWSAVMQQMVDFLYDQSFKDSVMALRLTVLELPALTYLLDILLRNVTADHSILHSASDSVRKIEHLFFTLGNSQALAKATSVREKIAAFMPQWSNARFNHERLHIERLQQQGQLQQALEKAQALLSQAINAGAAAYEGADHNLAGAHFLVGRILSHTGQATAALDCLNRAQHLFEDTGQQGEYMVQTCLTEQADCLKNLGRLEEAIVLYENSIAQTQTLEDLRSTAVVRGKLANTLLIQGFYGKAINQYEAAKAVFEQHNEPDSIAIIWQQMGIVYQESGHYNQSEQAYRESLAITSQHTNLVGQSTALVGLGNLYNSHFNRPEEGLAFLRQAVDIDVTLQNLSDEGITRHNIANTLVDLKLYDEARVEIERAILCKQTQKEAGTLWNSYNILLLIEQAQGHHSAAKLAWTQAKEAYLAYRQQGGRAEYESGHIADRVFDFIQKSQLYRATAMLGNLLQVGEEPDWLLKAVLAIQAVVKGERRMVSTDEAGLDYSSAAEILFLIERLEAMSN